MAIDETDLHRALDRACHLVGDVERADKVGAALYDASPETLIAPGTSATPMGRKQHAIGVNRLPVANGGRELDVAPSGLGVVGGGDRLRPGAGDSPELFPRLCDRFARDPGSSGLGIGLHLASGVVAAHGGRPTTDLAATAGARFQKKLPLADAALSESSG